MLGGTALYDVSGWSTHERWDGLGYPMGLRGRDIRSKARILSVVDAYEAITSDRPYRPARTHEEACQGLWARRGTWFDIAVVAAFQRAVFGRFPRSRLALSREKTGCYPGANGVAEACIPSRSTGGTRTVPPTGGVAPHATGGHGGPPSCASLPSQPPRAHRPEGRRMQPGTSRVHGRMERRSTSFTEDLGALPDDVR